MARIWFSYFLFSVAVVGLIVKQVLIPIESGGSIGREIVCPPHFMLWFWTVILGLAGVVLFVLTVIATLEALSSNLSASISRQEGRKYIINATLGAVFSLAATAIFSLNVFDMIAAQRFLDEVRNACDQYEATLQTRIATFEWKAVGKDERGWDRSTAPNFTYVLIDGSTKKLSRWQKTILEPAYRPSHDTDRVIYIIIEEMWIDSRSAAWQEVRAGKIDTIEPLRYRVWDVQVIDPLSYRMVATTRLHGVISGANFTDLFRRYRTEAERREWEKYNCLAPDEELLSWLGIPRRCN
jgi:hypothetical protein